MLRQIILLTILVFLTACGGGGGGGGGGGSAPILSSWQTINPGNTSQAALVSKYETPEYLYEYNPTHPLHTMQLIHASEAYAALELNGKAQAGQGLKIAIIDTGAKITHSEFINKTSGNFNYYDSLATGQCCLATDVTDVTGHGTLVASIIGANKNGVGLHGIAYNSTLVIAKGSNGPSGGFIIDDAIVTKVIGTGAKVLNFSAGGGNGADSLATARSNFLSGNVYNEIYKPLIDADVVLVVSSGNSPDPNPAQPARYAAFAETKGISIAVGSLEVPGPALSPSTWSNRCGDAMAYCMIAPGSASVASISTLPGGEYSWATGTSIAAPMVSGAAGVIRAAWPQLTAQQTVQILLRSATYVDVPGYAKTNIGTTTAPIYVNASSGHGALNLYAAVQAQGQNLIASAASLSVASLDSSGSSPLTFTAAGYDLQTSSIVSDPIFGDAFNKNIIPQLSSAVFFDDYGRDYKANLGNKISSRSGVNYSAQAFNNYNSQSIPLNLNFSGNSNFASEAKVQYQAYKNPTLARLVMVDRSLEDKTLANSTSFSFVQNFAKDFKAGFAFNANEIANIQSGKLGNLGFMSVNNLASNPYQSFLTNQNSSTIPSQINSQTNQRNFNQIFLSKSFFNQKFALNFSHQTSYQSNSMISKMGNRENVISDFSASYSPEKNSNFLLSFGNLNEFNNNFLNSKAEGAFSNSGDVKTSYVKLSATKQLLDGLSLITSFSHGTTTANGNSQGIFRNFNNIQSRSSAIGLTSDKFFKGNLGIIYSQPLRVYSGTATIDIPTGLDQNGNVIRYNANVSLKPQGKEQDFEVFFSKNINPNSNFRLNFITQKQPNNVKDAGTAYFLMGSYGVRF